MTALRATSERAIHEAQEALAEAMSTLDHNLLAEHGRQLCVAAKCVDRAIALVPQLDAAIKEADRA